MNRVFKVLWSHTLGKWVVTSELGRSRKKAKRTQLATTVATAVMVGAMGVSAATTSPSLTVDGQEIETELSGNISVAIFPDLNEVESIFANDVFIGFSEVPNSKLLVSEGLTFNNVGTESDLDLTVKKLFVYDGVGRGEGSSVLMLDSLTLEDVGDGDLSLWTSQEDDVIEIIEINKLNLNKSDLTMQGKDLKVEEFTINTVDIGKGSRLHLNLTFNEDGALVQSVEGESINNSGVLSGIANLEHKIINSGQIYVGNAFTHANSGKTRAMSSEFGVLTVDSYEGAEGSELHFGTELNGDESKRDQLIIQGDAEGESVVVVHPVGDVLKDSTEEGIHLVQVDKNNSSLKLDLDEIVDGYTFVDAWDLKEKEDGWFLQYAGAEKQEVVDPTDPEQPGGDKPGTGGKPSVDPVVRTEANAYLANLVMANEMFTMRYHDRLYAPKENGLWTQGKASFSKFKSNLTGDVSSKTDYFTIRIGKDLVSTDEYVMGIMAAYGHSTGKTENNRHDVRKTDHSSDAFAVGIYGSYTFAPHSYVDAWAQYVHARNKVEWGTKHFDYTEKYNSKGALLSLEAAYGVNIADSVYFQPQGQITYMGVKADTHKDARGREFGSNRGNVQLRLGARFFGENVFANGQGTPYVEANYIHNTKANKVKMQAASGGITDIELDGAKNLFQLKVGSDFNLNNNSKIGAHVSHTFGKKSYRDTQLNVDFRYNF